MRPEWIPPADGEKMAPLCLEFGISRKTGYTLYDRYEEVGLQGLTDRSRRPYRHANQLPLVIENTIVRNNSDRTTSRSVPSADNRPARQGFDPCRTEVGGMKHRQFDSVDGVVAPVCIQTRRSLAKLDGSI
jgi:hypothetical protein